jgi:hypothetical protein
MQRYVITHKCGHITDMQIDFAFYDKGITPAQIAEKLEALRDRDCPDCAEVAYMISGLGGTTHRLQIEENA